MQNEAEIFTQQVNFTRYKDFQGGHYESFFQRANHPTRPLAFWIRYTIFSPKDQPQDALAELWAIYFNGETGQHVIVKKEMPLKQCTFSTSTFFVQIDKAQLEPGKLFGMVKTNENALGWELTFASDTKPLFLLPFQLYTTNQQSFLEIATARLKIGTLWTPYMTLLVLRHNDKEYALNSLAQSLKAKGSFDYFTWNFRSETKHVAVEGSISAPREAFVGLKYCNPPGGSKYCLNSKIASCELRLSDKQLHTTETLSTQHRSAFEILTGDPKHGIEIRAKGLIRFMA